MSKCVLILDFGSQFTQLIARRVRELGFYSEIRPCQTKPGSVDLRSIQALVLSGGPACVTAEDAPEFDPAWLKAGIPSLGICYGMQLMAVLGGGTLEPGNSREYGHATLSIKDTSDLFYGFDANETTTVWMSHGDHVAKIPTGFHATAVSQGSPLAAMSNPSAKQFAIQFHPEVAHTPRGKEILSNFLIRIAKCQKNWDPENFISAAVEKIKQAVGPEAQVICGLSGGVDSTVAAALVHKAIGDRLHCIFVDNGLLRKHEVEEVVAALGPDGLGLKLHLAKAGEQFLSQLAGVTDPEKKRKIIGRVFIEVFEAETKRIPRVTHLVQGTLYPDVIESVSVRGPSVTIKTHHNVGGLPERMQLKLIEPLRELFKDEVRAIGRKMEIPEVHLKRQPFPGPGLAVRVLGEITPARLEILRNADRIFQEEIISAGIYDVLWQSFAVLLPVQSVGVMGDGRTYEQTIALRAVTSQDGMTADWYYMPEDFLRRVSNRITNEVRGVNRVVLDISSKPPATIEWE